MLPAFQSLSEVTHLLFKTEVVGLGDLISVCIVSKLVILPADFSTTSTSAALHGTTTVVDCVGVAVTASVPLPLFVAENHCLLY